MLILVPVLDQFALLFHSKYAVKHVYAKVTLSIKFSYLQLNWSEPEKHWTIRRIIGFLL